MLNHEAITRAEEDRRAHINAAYTVFNWRNAQADRLETDSRKQVSEQVKKLRELAQDEYDAAQVEANDRYHATMAGLVDGGGSNGIG